MKLSCVILTMGDRPAELARAIGSALAQEGDGLEVVVVGNGADVNPAPHGVKVVKLPENLGVAGGRNAGVEACGGDVALADTAGGVTAAATWCSFSTTTAGSPTRSSERMSPDVLQLILVLR